MAGLTIRGTSAAETLTGGSGNDTIYGGSGDDSIVGGGGNDFLSADDGNDTISGGAGNDSLYGGAGDDRLLVGNGNQIYDGGPGTDTFDASAATKAVQVDLSLGTVQSSGNSSISAVEHVIGSSFADSLTGSIGNDFLEGGAGNDTINGGLGNDTIAGGSGTDRLVGGLGNDVYLVDSATDTVVESASQGTDEVRTTLASYTLGANVENLTYVGSGSFVGTGNSADNVITGGAGNDLLTGGAGNDTIYGNGGSDTLAGGSGADQLVGGGSNVTFQYSADSAWSSAYSTTNSGDPSNAGPGTAFSLAGYSASNDVFVGTGTGNTLVMGDGHNALFLDDGFSPGTDSTRLVNVQTIQAGSGGQIVDLTSATVSYGDVTLLGGSGDDILMANAGNDSIQGGGGKDYLWGGSGNDTIAGGAGSDTLLGGAGNDKLIVNTADSAGSAVIADGGAGTDVLEIQLTAAQFTAARAELSAFQTFADNPANQGKTFTFSTLGNVQVTNAEQLRVLVDGVETSLNTAPVINTAATTTTLEVGHNASIAGAMAATDANGDALTYSLKTGPANGTVSFTDASGHYTYQAADVVGADSFVLQVSDGKGGVITQTVSVNVTNAAPIIDQSSTTSLTVGHGTSVTGTLAVTDADGDALSYSVKTAPANGSVTTDSQGHFTYQAGDGVGADSFVLQVSDGHGGITTQTVNATVTNAAPVVTQGSTSALTVGHDKAVTGTLAVTDVDGDALSYSVKTAPGNGTVTFTDNQGHFTYQAGDGVGADSFVLQVSDGHGGVTTQTVNVNVTNDGPVVGQGSTAALTVGHDKVVTGALNVTDADGDTLSYSVKTAPGNGTVTFTDNQGHFTYQAGDGVGADSFVLQVSDGHGGVTTQTVNATVTNADPTFGTSTSSALSVTHNHSVVGVIAATDADGDTLQYTLKTGPAYGTVTFTDANGSYVYQAGDVVGADSFTLQVSDGHGGVVSQVVSVTATNTDPAIWPASTTYFDISHNQTVDAQIVASDADGDTLTYSVLDAPQHGTITFTDDAGHYTYRADGAFDTDTYTLKVSDGHGGVATLVVNVTDPNSAPVISDTSTAHLSVGHNATVDGSIAANDAESDPLAYSLDTAPQHGTVTFTDSAGHYTYSAGDYVGSDSFTLMVDDGFGGLVSQTVTVDVTNDGPVVAAGSTSSLAVTHGHSASGVVAGADANGDALSFSLKTGPALGTLTFTDSQGHYVYQAGNTDGADQFVLQISDGHGGFADQTVTVGISNTGPTVAAGTTSSASAMHYASFNGTIAGFDADGDALSYGIQTGPRTGSLKFTDANGHYTYTAGDAAGVDSFTLQISDGHGGIATQTVNVGVTGTMDVSAATSSANINLASGTGASPDLLQYAIDVKGSGFDDTITGDARNNIISGGAGKDELHGGGGSDQLLGGFGDDKLFGEDGNDFMDGGDGADALNGGAGDDTMLGGIGNDGFFGGGGQDLVYGGDGADRIYGDGGNDTIFGGAGNDTLTGGGTSVTAAKGNNTFAWAQSDVVTGNGSSAGFDHITDFGVGDRLDFSGVFSSKPAVLANAIHVTDTTAGTVVSAAVGTGGAFVDVVMLDGVHHVTLDDLAHANQIVV